MIKTKENFDLIISEKFLFENCTNLFLTLKELISFNSSIIENLITLKFINLCLSINIKDLQPLKNVRRLLFDNCSIHFLSNYQKEDYDSYPKNLSQWSFNHGQTDTFENLIFIINQLGPLKFDLKLSNCFHPIYSFNNFIPLHTQLIFLNITCKHFQIDQPFSIQTRIAIFLTPILILNTQSSICPSIEKYSWLNLKSPISLRTFTCENRLIDLNFNINQTTTTTTTIKYSRINLTISTLFRQTTTVTKLTKPILINFLVVLVSIVMLFIACIVFLIRFIRK